MRSALKNLFRHVENVSRKKNKCSETYLQYLAILIEYIIKQAW